MIRVVPLFACVLTLLFAAGLAVIHAQPSDTPALRDFLGGSTSCQPPCFMGIRPGTTTVDQAMQLLSNSSWVSHVERNQVEVVWTWSGQQPGFLDASVPGVALISFQNQNQITDIIVQSAVPFGEPWIALGSPTHGEGEFYLDPYDQPFVAHNYVYEQYGVLITATLPCPANQAALWQTKVLIEWGDYSRYYPATDVQNQLESHLWCRANP